MNARLSAALALGVLAHASAAQSPPAFELVRANEDWRNVSGAPAYKRIALSDDGEATVSLGGEWRLRIDAYDAPRYGIGREPDVYALQRALVHADWRFGERVRVFAQLGREDAIGKKPPLAASDADRGDVQNLFVDVNDTQHRAALRLGRQELMFNPTQRFVSVREGPNVRQSFDGARATWRRGDVVVDAFAVRPVEYRPGAFDDRGDDAQAFYGAYASRKFGASATVDAYWFGLRRDDAVFGGVRGDERRDSIGARYAGAARGFDVDVEAIVQRGRFAGRAIRAWAFGAIAGYTARGAWSPRYVLEIDAGSGDRGGAGDTLGTFNPLFPKGAYFDESALMSWANAVVVRPSVAVQPHPGVSVRASLLMRRRQSRDDVIYLQPYAPLAATGANRARDIGRAWVIDAAWRLDRAWNLSAQIARHEAGAAVEQAGGRDADFAMFVAQWKF